MARVVVHFGAHKTGSTALQAYFVANRAKLQQAGVVYPTRWQGHLKGHHELAFAVKSGGDESSQPDVSTLRAAISDLASGDAVILLSSEEFSLLDEVELARLAEVLGDNDVEAVLFLRHWADLIPSIWQELIKQGSTANLPLFLARVLARPGSQDVLDYQKGVARIAKAFGKDSLRLVSYEALIASRRDIGEMFCRDILRIELVDAKPTARANESWPPTLVECVRLFNVLAVARGDVPDSTWPRAAFERMRAKGSPAIELLQAQLAAHVQNLWILVIWRTMSPP